MVFIFIVNIIIYFIAIAWGWSSIENVDKKKKIYIIIIETIVIYIMTLIIFQFTKNGIQYDNAKMQKDVQNMLVIIFTGINCIVLNPQIGKIIDKLSEEKKDEVMLKKRIIILLIILVIGIIIETGYMKSIQEGILSIYYNIQNS